jgi:7-cyano-7-deazaguanine synthase
VAPLLKLSKLQILRLGRSLGVDFRWTLSCYDPGKRGKPCGACDSCRIRNRAEKELRRQ